MAIRVFELSLGDGDAFRCILRSTLGPVSHVEVISANFPASDGRQLAKALQQWNPDLLALCVSGAGLEGAQAVFEIVRRQPRELAVMVILETAADERVKRLVELGAADFCLAPLRLEDLVPRIERWACTAARDEAVIQGMEWGLGLRQFLGKSRFFLEAISKIPKLARCDANAFLSGETGTGKEMCARAIHHLGPRADHPFVPVNCGAIPSELVENELFGHEAGAFTSASAAVRGVVHDAEGGTLFLDEIDSLPLPTQVKILRFLQDREYRPLGARKSVRADVRIIAASNIDLGEAVRAGRFRSDLYYRLNVLPLRLPALRERREDIPLLARHFVLKYGREFSSGRKELSRGAIEKLLVYDWPGNVRELENVVERAVVLSERSLIMGEDICLPECETISEDASFKTLKARAVAQFEAAYVRRLLVANGGNVSKAARAAKKNRRAFWEIMRKHDIATPIIAEPARSGQTPPRARTELS